MNTSDYWDEVYRTTAPDAVSWYRPHLEISLDMIRQAASGLGSAILDVGGGESTLADDLISAGFAHVTVLDISPAALEGAKKRLGAAADHIRWIAADLTKPSLPHHCPNHSIDLWHDRAVFHFLTEAGDRAAYVRNLLHCVRPGGHAVIGTFGPDAPPVCSGLPLMRYDSNSLCRELGSSFVMTETREELHLTPSGTVQQFVYCSFRVVPTRTRRNL